MKKVIVQNDNKYRSKWVIECRDVFCIVVVAFIAVFIFGGI